MNLTVKKQNFRNSILKALVLSIGSAGFTYVFLRQWVVMAISLGPVDKIYQTIDAASQLAFLVVFVTSFISSYYQVRIN
jgi:hypothetical protein